jgi:hypothetical protein
MSFDETTEQIVKFRSLLDSTVFSLAKSEIYKPGCAQQGTLTDTPISIPQALDQVMGFLLDGDNFMLLDLNRDNPLGFENGTETQIDAIDPRIKEGEVPTYYSKEFSWDEDTNMTSEDCGRLIDHWNKRPEIKFFDNSLTSDTAS